MVGSAHPTKLQNFEQRKIEPRSTQRARRGEKEEEFFCKQREEEIKAFFFLRALRVLRGEKSSGLFLEGKSCILAGVDKSFWTSILRRFDACR
jgi:hypothetical protein